MDKNSLNTNKQFMIGNGMLAFGVFAVIIIFLYMSFRFQRKADKVQTYEGVYNIELTNSFAGDSIAVYLNDSLLLDQTMPDANLKVEIKRFAEDNVLMVVDNKTDKTTPFNLNPEGSRVEVKKSGDVIYILERKRLLSGARMQMVVSKIILPWNLNIAKQNYGRQLLLQILIKL